MYSCRAQSLYIQYVIFVVDSTLQKPIVLCSIDENADLPIKTWRRDWRKYSREMLNNELSKITFDLDIKDVQGMWNNIENHLIRVADLLAPLTAYTRNKTNDSVKTPAVIKRKMNQRKKLKAKYFIKQTDSYK